MGKRLQDFSVNKFYGYYLVFYANDHYLLAALIYRLGQKVVSFLAVMHLITPQNYKIVATPSNPLGKEKKGLVVVRRVLCKQSPVTLRS